MIQMHRLKLKQTSTFPRMHSHEKVMGEEFTFDGVIIELHAGKGRFTKNCFWGRPL